MPQSELPPQIVRAGDPYPWSTRLGQPSRIRDLVIAEGFEIRSVSVGKKTFGPDFIALDALPEDRDNPKYGLAAYRVLPSDDVRFDIVNASEDDRMFEGVLSYDLAPVIGQGAAIAGSPSARRAPTLPQSGSRKLAVPPQPASGGNVPRSPGMKVDRMGHGVPTAQAAAMTRALRTVTPGTNQIVVLVTRRQAEMMQRLVQGERYMSPLERQELTGPLKRALGRLTIEEESGPVEESELDSDPLALPANGTPSGRELGAS